VKHSRFFVFVFVFVAAPALAQQVPADDPFAEARVRVGALALDPRIVVSNIGVDTNVFNTTDNRQRDFTLGVKPGADLFLRTGRGLVTVSGNVEYVYFNRFATERSINSDVRGQYEFRFNRFRPYASVSWLDTKERPGFEIDARARRYETGYRAGADLRIASKSTIRLEFRRLDFKFDGDAVFNGTALNQQLNRTGQTVELNWRQRLTALTTWITRASRETERFEFEQARNGDSLRAESGFELGRFALIRGSAFAGVRWLRPAAGGVIPEFTGVTADVDVSYTAPTQTRLGAAVQRDVRYSYDLRTPYYVETGWTATVTQRLRGRLDAQLSGGRDRLAYQMVASSTEQRPREFVGRFGGGIGYALNDFARISFDVNSFHRSSEAPGREYGAVRAGVNFSYVY